MCIFVWIFHTICFSLFLFWVILSIFCFYVCKMYFHPSLNPVFGCFICAPQSYLCCSVLPKHFGFKWKVMPQYPKWLWPQKYQHLQKCEQQKEQEQKNEILEETVIVSAAFNPPKYNPPIQNPSYKAWIWSDQMWSPPHGSTNRRHIDGPMGENPENLPSCEIFQHLILTILVQKLVSSWSLLKASGHQANGVLNFIAKQAYGFFFGRGNWLFLPNTNVLKFFRQYQGNLYYDIWGGYCTCFVAKVWAIASRDIHNKFANSGIPKKKCYSRPRHCCSWIMTGLHWGSGGDRFHPRKK